MAIEPPGRPPRSAARRKRLAAVVAWLRLCLARRRERIGLGELGDRELRDLGLTRNQATREAARPAWHGLYRR